MSESWTSKIGKALKSKLLLVQCLASSDFVRSGRKLNTFGLTFKAQLSEKRTKNVRKPNFLPYLGFLAFGFWKYPKTKLKPLVWACEGSVLGHKNMSEILTKLSGTGPKVKRPRTDSDINCTKLTFLMVPLHGPTSSFFIFALCGWIVH